MRRVLRVLRNLLRRTRVERELDDEMSAILELLADEKVRGGMAVDAARRAARRELGSLPSLKEQMRAVRAGAAVDDLWRDLRCGARLLRKNPTFTVVAILTLALGTGANAAIFQLVNALRLRPLPVEQPQDLVVIGLDQHGKARVGKREVGQSVFSEPLWQEIRAHQQAFSRMLAWGSGRWDLSIDGEVIWADGYYVSGGYFQALGVRAGTGRLFAETDDHPGCGSPGAVLSYEFWQRRYDGSPAVVGQTIMLDRRPFPVIGVAPQGFLGVESGRAFDVALPLCAETLLRGRDAATGRRDVWWLGMMGRLEPGWTIARAAAHLAALSPAVFEATVSPTYTAIWAKNYSAFTLTAEPGQTGMSMLPPIAYAVLWMLLGATALVLLLTCANLANLMLARSTARGREIAVRLAVGATRGRVVAQLLTESALLAALGALSGFFLARWISQTLVAVLNTGSLPVRIVIDVTPDWRVFALTTTVGVLVCLLFGLGPALKVTRRDPASAWRRAPRATVTRR